MGKEGVEVLSELCYFVEEQLVEAVETDHFLL
jgi:hypothetical protein